MWREECQILASNVACGQNFSLSSHVCCDTVCAPSVQIYLNTLGSNFLISCYLMSICYPKYHVSSVKLTSICL